jgi:glycosyltransferase involved in cell wall biosynthesis
MQARAVLEHVAVRVAGGLAGHKRVSAMIRVKNEEEFLWPAALSIVDSVDEIVIVDNGSTDGTPAIVEALQRAYPTKVRRFHYPHEIARVGAETAALLSGAPPRDGLRLSGAFYNWCLRRCAQPFVLKWDGDMIATPGFHRALAEWKRSPHLVLMMRGANVYPDREHFAAARSSDREALAANLTHPGMPGWVRFLSHDYLEPRLFPRLLARYDHVSGWTQSLTSPFLHRKLRRWSCRTVAGISHLHLKFCKRDPYSNYSDDLRRVIVGNLTAGPVLDREAREVLHRWVVTPARRRATS